MAIPLFWSPSVIFVRSATFGVEVIVPFDAFSVSWSSFGTG